MTVRSTRRLMVAAAGVAACIAGLGAWSMTSASAGSEPNPGASLVTMPPCRLLDTRPGESTVGPRSTPIGAKEEWTFSVTGANGNCNLPSTAVAVVGTLTGVNFSGTSYFTLFRPDAPRAVASNLNWLKGQAPVANSFTAALSADGKLAIFNAFDTADALIDITAYFEAGDYVGMTQEEILALVRNSGIVGEPGPQGPTGPQGAAGPAGPRGSAGAAGPKGATGTPGPAGSQGPIGPEGPAGPQGRAALVGDHVESGVSDPAGACPDDGFYLNTTSGQLFWCDKGTWQPGGVIAGPGATGPAGPTGPEGPVGPTGATGPEGPPGPTSLGECTQPVPLPLSTGGPYCLGANGVIHGPGRDDVDNVWVPMSPSFEQLADQQARQPNVAIVSADGEFTSNFGFTDVEMLSAGRYQLGGVDYAPDEIPVVITPQCAGESGIPVQGPKSALIVELTAACAFTVVAYPRVAP